MERLQPHFVAQLTFLTTAEGGRKTAAKSGYRCLFRLRPEMDNEGQITFLGRELVEPGETVEAEIRLLVPEFQRGRLYPGMEFEVQEGNRRFGTGRIVRVLDPELKMG